MPRTLFYNKVKVFVPERTMTTCYTSYDSHHHHLAMQTTPIAAVATSCGTARPSPAAAASSSVVSPQQKDYSRPLHVDCSVEYELPNQAKPPVGVRNEPLLMIHPCYFRKIESQRRSPFVNNLPTRPSVPQQQQSQPQQQPSSQQSVVAPQQQQQQAATAIANKRRLVRGQQLPQQVPQQAAQYPVQYAESINRQHQLASTWSDATHLAPPAAAYCGRGGGGAVGIGAIAAIKRADTAAVLGHCWPDPERSPDRPDIVASKHILTGKYRQYLRAHRLHPYVASAIPLASTFPQLHQQVCYNV